MTADDGGGRFVEDDAIFTTISGKFLPVLLLKTPYFGQYNLIMATPPNLTIFLG